jgi:hypothetical protein
LFRLYGVCYGIFHILLERCDSVNTPLLEAR